MTKVIERVRNAEIRFRIALCLIVLIVGGIITIPFLGLWSNGSETQATTNESQNPGRHGHPAGPTKELLLDKGFYSKFVHRNPEVKIISIDNTVTHGTIWQIILIKGEETGDIASLVIHPYPSRVRLATDQEPVTASDAGIAISNTTAIFQVGDKCTTAAEKGGAHIRLTKIEKKSDN